jgi:acyl-CoA reductase-like NAD-dependent aldehyde dehydrogenase
MQVYQNFIGGEFVTSQGKRRLHNVNPADTRDIVGEIVQSTAAEAAQAVEVAAQAFKSWRATPAPKRGAIIAKAAQIMARRKEEIARTLTREEGKLYSEALGEMQRAINIAEFAGAHGRRLNGEVIPLELANNVGYTMKEPVGVAAIITPWNFPAAIPIWKIAPALVAGNTVVFKPASLVPATAQLLMECFVEAGLPAGVLNMVIGSGGEVGNTFVDHPAVRLVSFTGSTDIGLGIYQRAAGRGIRAQCEMGGKNPVIVCDDADLDLAVSGVYAGAFGSTGQRCTATSRVIIQHGVADAFLERLMAQVQAMRIGNPLDADIDMGPSVDASQLKTVLNYIEIGKNQGAELLIGGDQPTSEACAHGYFVNPTIFDKVQPHMRIHNEEIFGPVLSVVRVESFDEAIEVANHSEFGLTSSIYTRDLTRTFRYIQEIETGITHVNSPTLGGEAQMPFGGMKNTGVGPREQGTEVFDFYTETKAVYIDFTGAKREGKLY